MVWSKDLYIQEVHRQRNDVDEEIQSDDTKQNNTRIHRALEEEIRTGRLRHYLSKNLGAPNFVLPKVTKIDNPGRPHVHALHWARHPVRLILALACSTHASAKIFLKGS